MISKRLKTIADMIMKDEVVFDCGSDHALLPCFLLMNNISPKVYAGDLRMGPLRQAEYNIDRLNLTGRVIPVLSNGLEKMPEEVRVLTISGMGFHTVKEILDNGNLDNLKQIIVQVNRNVDKLRQYIDDHNYSILDERIVNDGFYYEIVAFSPLKSTYKLNYQEIKYGPILLKKCDREFLEYLFYRCRVLKEIYLKSNDSSLLEEIDEIEKIISNCMKKVAR